MTIKYLVTEIENGEEKTFEAFAESPEKMKEFLNLLPCFIFDRIVNVQPII